MKHKKYRDIFLLKKIVRFYSYTGTFACMSRKNKLLLIPFYILGLSYLVRGYLNYMESSTFSSVGFFLHNCIMMTLLVFSLLCLKHSFEHEMTWDAFFENVEAFDLLIRKANICLGENVYKYYSKFCLSNTFYFLVYLLLFFTKAVPFTFENLIGTSYTILINTQLLVTILVLEKLYALIGKRFECLTAEMIYRFLFLRPNEEFEKGHKLKEAYFLLTQMVKGINELFGQRILLILLITFLDVLGSFDYTFLEAVNQSPTYKSNVFRRCSRTVFFLVSLSNIISFSFFPYFTLNIM